MLVPANRPPGFVNIDLDTIAVFWDCLCEAGSAGDCDCPDAMWFERVGLYDNVHTDTRGAW